MRNILECMVIVMEMLITIILQFVQLNNKSKVDVYILDKNNNDDGLSQERLWLISRKVYIQSPWQFVHPNSQTQFLVRWKNFPDIWLSIYNLLVKAGLKYKLINFSLKLVRSCYVSSISIWWYQERDKKHFHMIMDRQLSEILLISCILKVICS